MQRHFDGLKVDTEWEMERSTKMTEQRLSLAAVRGVRPGGESMTTNESAYRFLRVQAPNVVRLIRGALDNGMSSEKIKRLARQQCEPMAHAVDAAVEHMAGCDTAGVVEWDGMRFTFRD